MKASESLKGLTVGSGWKVLERVDGSKDGTGGHFSTGYIVEKNGIGGFLKALDFSAAFTLGEDTVKRLQELTSAFLHERDILEHCKERRHSRVVMALEHGSVQIPGMGKMEGQVQFLIFEKASTDVRRQLQASNQRDYVWAARAARDICLGLWQVHRDMIAHQDMKPSNTLVFPNDIAKISDFGRASMKGRAAQHDEFRVAGDRTYTSPELLYGFVSPEFNARRFGCDLYMLGNLICFLFSGVSLNTELYLQLASEHHYAKWQGSYAEVLPYLFRAHRLAIEEISSAIDPVVRADVKELIVPLTEPDLALRGFPKSIGRADQYSLERFLSKFELLLKEAEVRYRLARASK